MTPPLHHASRIPRLRVACQDCNLTQICIPSGMQPDQVNALTDTVRRNRLLRKGETIYRAGERFAGIFALKSGTARLCYADRVGNESIIAVLLPGELLGFDGLFSGRYRCSLVALESSSYCELPRHELDELVQRVPAISQILLQRTSEQFDNTIHRIAINQRPADERLATFLLDLADRYRRRGFSGDSFNLSLTRQEIGNHLGLALETVSRLFSKLENHGLLSVKGRLIHILDVDGLKCLCSEP